jgi:probable HAF family extracellular repeat protein
MMSFVTIYIISQPRTEVIEAECIDFFKGAGSMTTRLVNKLLLGLVGAVVIAIGNSKFTAVTATTSFSYSVTDLGTLSGNNSLSRENCYAEGINDQGQVVGICSQNQGDGRFSFAAFKWNNGKMTRLSGGSNGSAKGINNAGQVVGHVTVMGLGTTRTPHATLWNNDGSAKDLKPVSGTHNTASSINYRGLVVGSSTRMSDLSKQAFLWQNGIMKELGTLGGKNSVANGINYRGLVVGESSTSSGLSHAFLWNKGKMIDLGTLGGSSSVANGINNRGQVVGGSDTNSSYHAFKWENDTMTDLGSLNGKNTIATAINNRGTVVGHSLSSPNAALRAFVWRHGKMTDLNSLLPATSGWVLYSATDINNRGQIVGYGNKGAFLLTPTWITK